MNPHINTISNRLSLRPPQRESLEILARICEILPLEKDADVAAALQAVKTEFPAIADFEREFPSLCFAPPQPQAKILCGSRKVKEQPLLFDADQAPQFRESAR